MCLQNYMYHILTSLFIWRLWVPYNIFVYYGGACTHTVEYKKLSFFLVFLHCALHVAGTSQDRSLQRHIIRDMCARIGKRKKKKMRSLGFLLDAPLRRIIIIPFACGSALAQYLHMGIKRFWSWFFFNWLRDIYVFMSNGTILAEWIVLFLYTACAYLVEIKQVNGR